MTRSYHAMRALRLPLRDDLSIASGSRYADWPVAQRRGAEPIGACDFPQFIACLLVITSAESRA